MRLAEVVDEEARRAALLAGDGAAGWQGVRNLTAPPVGDLLFPVSGAPTPLTAGSIETLIGRLAQALRLTALERDVLAYAESMSETEPTVTDELVESLREQLGEDGVLELTAVIAFANFTTRANVALGIESDGFAAACGLEPLAQPTTPRDVVGS